MAKYSEKELEFLNGTFENFVTIKAGFMKNLEYPIIQAYHEIYKTHFDKDYILNAWCGDCVFNMVQRIMVKYDNEQVKEAPIVKTKKK
jgi:hypothetical protein